MNSTDNSVLLMLARVAEAIGQMSSEMSAQSDRLDDVLTRPVMVELPASPDVRVAPSDVRVDVDMGPVASAINELKGNLSLASSGTDEVLRVMIGKLEDLAEKLTQRQMVVSSGGGTRRDTRDFYGQGELIPTVTATTSAVTLTQKAEEWWFRAEGGDAYIDPFGGTADADAILIDDGQWHPLNVKTDTVSIYAPSGVTVSGYALRYIDGA